MDINVVIKIVDERLVADDCEGCVVCNFVDGKTSYYTPQMKLCYDAKVRPFSVHQKIEGYTLGDRIYHLSHTAITGVAYDATKFINFGKVYKV